jgi:transposase-like protein
VPHPNAPLSELGRLRLARCILDQGWPVARAAERFQVSRATAQRWAQRYRDQGRAGMADRSSRPHHSPRRTPAPVVPRIVHLRWKQRLGPAQIGPGLAWPPPPCMLSWSAAVSAGLATWTGPPASQSAATSTTSLGAGPHRCQEAGQHPGWWWPPVPGPRHRNPQQPGRPVKRSGQPLSQPVDRPWVHPCRGR